MDLSSLQSDVGILLVATAGLVATLIAILRDTQRRNVLQSL
jgi:hypothetical protein